MAAYTVLYDASVLYPAPLRDALMHLAMTDLFRARWTDTIHEEWIRAVLRDRPDLSRARLERTRALMDAAVLDPLVEDSADLIPGLALPDPNDRHVLAAAIRAGADVIVTANLADFPREALAPHGIEAQHPDAFISGLIELAHMRVCSALRMHRESLRHPPKSVDEYIETLARQSLPRTVSALRAHVALL